MEDLQTDTLSDYAKNQNPESANKDDESSCAATLLNGCEEIDDPLDLMDNCDNESIGSNSDVWKGSDSEEESFDNKENPPENTETDTNKQPETNKMNDIIEWESKEGEKNEEDITSEKTAQDDPGDDTGKQIIESEEMPNENSVIESEEPNTTQESDTMAEKNKEPENETPDEREQEQLTNSEEKETNSDEKETKPEEHKQVDNIEEKNDQEDTTDNTTENVEENAATSTAEHVDKDTGETAQQKHDTTSKEAGRPAETTSKDPLTSEEAEKDILSNDNAEKDSLNLDSSEKDPLAADGDGDVDTLPSRRPDRNNDGQDDDESQIDYDDDDDFNPLLLCPEVSMAVDESPVITNSGPVPNDGNSSPLPYEPVFSTYVDEVTGAEISFNLNPEEQELRRRLYGPTNPVQITKIHCTACNVHLGSALEGQNNRFVHPLLKVLICKECYHFYTSGEFEKDEDGSELYCRWCGQGGQVLCCSKCEFVFCKRCIRTNFGRKKMFEIRDSDSWDCFRCAPTQLITQRIACYEFFEYVRREISRASALNDAEIWSKDHSRCCNKEKKKSLENGEEVKKQKRKKGEVDPDYNPLLNKPVMLPGQQIPPANSPVSSKLQTYGVSKGIVIPKPVQILPRSKPKDNDIEFVRHIPAPQVALNPINRPGISAQYRSILPSQVRPVMQPPSLVRINSQPMPPLMPTGRLLNSALQGRPVNTSHTMKHEWFEKTVRAAARVNSHLSYTLTQLNKAQSQAASVEELAVVHNKLQEILSSSINSLIQIRKNLRTEFIAGIKTVRLPSKKVESFANDDDVIFVSAPSTGPTPSTSQAKNVPDPIVIIDNSNKSNVSSNSAKASETAPMTERPKGYLKVKSVLELQNVPSECITIPDDTPTPTPTPSSQVTTTENSIPPTEIIVCNGVSNSESTPSATSTARSKTPDPLSITPEPPNQPEPEPPNQPEPEPADKTSESSSKTSEINSKIPTPDKITPTPDKITPTSDKNTPILENSPKTTEPPAKKLKLDSTNEPTRDLRTRRSKERLKTVAYNVKEAPSAEVKRMQSVTVKLAKVDLEDLQKRLPNGCH